MLQAELTALNIFMLFRNCSIQIEVSTNLPTKLLCNEAVSIEHYAYGTFRVVQSMCVMLFGYLILRSMVTLVYVVVKERL